MEPDKTQLTDEAKKLICAVKNKLRVTKVVCTRSVKGRAGDHYVGFSAAWDTIQDDAGGGADMISPQEGDEKTAYHQGMTVKESKIAALILGMQADIAAHQHAAAGGNIPTDQANAAIKAIKVNYGKMLADLFKENGNGNGDKA